MAIIEH